MNTLTFVVILSNPPPVASNRAERAFCNSSSLCSCFSCSCPSTPVRAVTSSRFRLMSCSVRMYASPASSPGPPKMSAIAVPTTAALSGSSLSLALTCWMTSNVVIAPVRSASCTS